LGSRRLYYKRTIEIESTKATMLPNLASTRISQSIESKAIVVQIDDTQQPSLKFLHPRQVEATFEDGFLHPLACRFTRFCYTAKASPPFLGLGVHVVANDHQHVTALSF